MQQSYLFSKQINILIKIKMNIKKNIYIYLCIIYMYDYNLNSVFSIWKYFFCFEFYLYQLFSTVFNIKTFIKQVSRPAIQAIK